MGNNKVSPIFCFGPKTLLDGPAGSQFYTCYAIKLANPDRYSFNYIITNPEITSDNKIVPKFAQNNEELPTLTDLYSRYYSFIEQFPEHERENDVQFILAENPTLISLHSRFIDYCTKRTGDFIRQFISLNKDKIIEQQPKPPSFTITNFTQKIFNFLKKSVDKK